MYYEHSCLTSLGHVSKRGLRPHRSHPGALTPDIPYKKPAKARASFSCAHGAAQQDLNAPQAYKRTPKRTPKEQHQARWKINKWWIMRKQDITA